MANFPEAKKGELLSPEDEQEVRAFIVAHMPLWHDDLGLDASSEQIAAVTRTYTYVWARFGVARDRLVDDLARHFGIYWLRDRIARLF